MMRLGAMKPPGAQPRPQEQNRGGDNVGALLDNVTVTAVPEPESYAMIMAGLGLMGFIVRRRKNGQV